jgi:DNA helicase-2/ATP-dependent DNA helicase PcrA
MHGGWRNQGGGGKSTQAWEAEKRYGAPPKSNPTPSFMPPKAPPKVVEHVPSADFQASDTSVLEAGMKVEHQKFGFGEVLKMEGAAHNPIATIRFEHNGEKKIMLNYAKLRIIQ